MYACMELLIAFRCTCTMTIKLSILFYSIPFYLAVAAMCSKFNALMYDTKTCTQKILIW